MTTQEILVKAGQLILSLSILVVLHELGHFIPAKLFKTKVEKFYLFFDPWFSLFKFKKGDTEYGVGWLPLGGYVKISGMIDESMDKEQMSKPAQPWEFRSKPAWQRLIIMIGGVFVNETATTDIYTMILWHYGEEYLPNQSVKYGISTDSLAQSIGLRDGDKIVAVGSKSIDNFDAIPGEIILGEAKSLRIERDGQQMDVAIPKGFVNAVIKRKGMFVGARILPILDTVPLKSEGYKVGFRKGDRILAVNDSLISYNHEFIRTVRKDTGKIITVRVLRGVDTVVVTAKVPGKGFGGIGPDPGKQLEIATKHYTFAQAIPAGFNRAISTLVKYVQQLRLIFVSEEVKASESLGGFMSIGNLFPSVWDWQSFWTLTALLSIILAFMNILPIPALDGGHVVFLVYEMIAGRKPSEKFMEYAQIAGMVILFGLLLYANGLDVWRWITAKF